MADRMLALAENDREMAPHALAALKGMPGRRMEDPRVAALARRIADPDRTVRMQASRVVTPRDPLASEQDPEVREMLQLRLDELR